MPLFDYGKFRKIDSSFCLLDGKLNKQTYPRYWEYINFTFGKFNVSKSYCVEFKAYKFTYALSLSLNTHDNSSLLAVAIKPIITN